MVAGFGFASLQCRFVFGPQPLVAFAFGGLIGVEPGYRGLVFGLQLFDILALGGLFGLECGQRLIAQRSHRLQAFGFTARAR